MNRLSLLAVVAAVFVVFVGSTRAAIAQEISSDDFAAATLSAADLPGFQVNSDSTPTPAPGTTRDQFQRLLTETAPTDGKLVLLTIILSAPNDANPCLPLLPAAIAQGQVFSGLNSDLPNFALLGSLGVGDVDSAATWADLDTGANQWTSLYAAAFMRGKLSVYLFYRTWGALPDLSVFAGIVQAQDARLQQVAASAPTSPLGQMLTTAVPPAASAAAECSQ